MLTQHFKLWYIYAMEYYSAIKANKAESFVEMWIDLEFVIRSKVSTEREKQIMYINVHMWNLEKGTDKLICRAAIDV